MKSVRSLQVLSAEILGEQVAQLNSSFSGTKWIIRHVSGANSGATGRSTILTSSFKFKSFPKTWKFLNKVVMPANTLRHHPTITTTYNKVQIDLTTHDADNQITSLDLTLAQLISKTYQEFEDQREPRVPSSQESNEMSQQSISLIDASRIINDLVQSSILPPALTDENESMSDKNSTQTANEPEIHNKLSLESLRDNLNNSK